MLGSIPSRDTDFFFVWFSLLRGCSVPCSPSQLYLMFCFQFKSAEAVLIKVVVLEFVHTIATMTPTALKITRFVVQRHVVEVVVLHRVNKWYAQKHVLQVMWTTSMDVQLVHAKVRFQVLSYIKSSMSFLSHDILRQGTSNDLRVFVSQFWCTLQLCFGGMQPIIFTA